MSDAHQELLNVYDEVGQVVGTAGRQQAKASGQPVGAVNALLIDGQRRVLLQQRRPDTENGGRWDKTVGGHVSAGEEFDACLLREGGEELFEDGRSPRVRLASSRAALDELVRAGAAAQGVVLYRAALQLNLRDVRYGPGGDLRNVLYHVAIYLGRTDLRLEAFTPAASELAALRFFEPAEVDRLLLDAQLAPNMAFLWLTQAQALLRLAD